MSVSSKPVAAAPASPRSFDSRIIIFAVIAVVLAGGAYWFFLRERVSDDGVPAALRPVVAAERKKDVKAIAAAITDKNPDVAARAVQALGEVGNRQEHAQYLQPALVDSRPKVREQAMIQYARVGDPTNVAPLTTALERDGSREVRAAAAQAMGAMRTTDAPAWNALYKGLVDPDPVVRHSAWGAVQQIFQGVRFNYDPDQPGTNESRAALVAIQKAMKTWKRNVELDVQREQQQGKR